MPIKKCLKHFNMELVYIKNRINWHKRMLHLSHKTHYYRHFCCEMSTNIIIKINGYSYEYIYSNTYFFYSHQWASIDKFFLFVILCFFQKQYLTTKIMIVRSLFLIKADFWEFTNKPRSRKYIFINKLKSF